MDDIAAKKMCEELFPVKYHSKSMRAAMMYIVFKKILHDRYYRQEDAAESYGVTTVAVRNNMKSILREAEKKDISISSLYEKHKDSIIEF